MIHLGVKLRKYDWKTRAIAKIAVLSVLSVRISKGEEMATLEEAAK
jgi:hypothetical protein